MSSVIARLAQRFIQMKLKKEPIQCANAASKEEIDDHFEILHFIEPSLSQDNLKVNTAPALQKFLDTHCHSTHYVFQMTHHVYSTQFKWIQRNTKNFICFHSHFWTLQKSTIAQVKKTVLL